MTMVGQASRWLVFGLTLSAAACSAGGSSEPKADLLRDASRASDALGSDHGLADVGIDAALESDRGDGQEVARDGRPGGPLDDVGLDVPLDGDLESGGPHDAAQDGSNVDSGRPIADAADAGSGSGFVHPGILVSRAQLDFVRRQIESGAEPWTTAMARAKSSRFAALEYQPRPRATVECGSFNKPDLGCSDESSDVVAAYTQALLWYLTDDETYAKNAVRILNAWSSTLKEHTNANAALQSAWSALMFARAAEIVRSTSSVWGAMDVAAFGTLLRDVYLPKVVRGSRANGNWELAMAEATIAIGVFLDDRNTFDRGVELWRGRVPAYIYLESDGPLPLPQPGTTSSPEILKYWSNPPQLADGLAQETCRDLPHASLGYASLFNAAETALIQGVDLYALEARRITTGLEFHTQFLDGVTVPSWLCNGTLVLGGSPTWEIGYNHYANRRGMSLPHTKSVILRKRPAGVGLNVAWETLTHAGIDAHDAAVP